jgi:hypothetical protein
MNARDWREVAISTVLSPSILKKFPSIRNVASCIQAWSFADGKTPEAKSRSDFAAIPIWITVLNLRGRKRSERISGVWSRSGAAPDLCFELNLRTVPLQGG